MNGYTCQKRVKTDVTWNERGGRQLWNVKKITVKSGAQ